MSDYPTPETLSHQSLAPILDKLHVLLENLPNQLPSKPVNGPDASHYASLVGYQPDEDLVELTGSKAGALNMHLERLFGHAARSMGDGTLLILERGPSVCALYYILYKHCNKYPNDNMLKKWVIDVVKGAEKVYNTHQINHLKEHNFDAFQDAVSSSLAGSLGAQLEASESSKSSSSQPSKLPNSNLQAMFSDTGLVTRQGTLNLAPLQAAGKKAKAKDTKKFQNSVDHIIMRLICVRGLVPNILDSREWKELMNKLNDVYKPSSSDVFRDKYIPQEAVFVRNIQMELLKNKENLI
ncbi:hypothetical protein B0H34DRAFT_799839 [Crassisporium funariophilum]|nr:hypothetical protein B0H34DRAFT_799839 [Crassisporium funariophilum]